MAHNYYRIPLRIRFKSLMELQPSEPETLLRSKCRKHRRKLRFLLNHYERRQRQHKWMETHVWHAKRFGMEDKWGFKIPYRSIDKSGRTVYRLSQRDGACIVDQSYYRTVLIEGEENYQKTLLYFGLSETQYQQTINFIDPIQNTLICPLKVNVFSAKQNIIIQVHPAAFTTIFGYLASQNILHSELFLNNFVLISQLCGLQHLYNVFKPLCLDDDSKISIESLQGMAFDSSQLDSRQIIILNLDKENLDQQFKMNERVFNYELSSASQSNTDDYLSNPLYRDKRQERQDLGKINQATRNNEAQKLSLGDTTSIVYKTKNEVPNLDQLSSSNYYYKQHIKSITEKKRLLESQIKLIENFGIEISGKQLRPIQWIGTQRSAFTHRKDNQRNKIKHLITKLKKAKETHDVLRKEKQLQQSIQDVQMKEVQHEENKTVIKDSAHISVIIIKNENSNPSGFGTSYNILVPQGYGLGVFRRLVYSGCKAIGHREFLSLKLECSEPIYPDDYPHTQIGHEQALLIAKSKLETYCKRPPSKRMNFQKINSLHPFIPSIIHQHEYSFVRISSLQRGVPFPKTPKLLRIIYNDLIYHIEDDIVSQLDHPKIKGISMRVNHLTFFEHQKVSRLSKLHPTYAKRVIDIGQGNQNRLKQSYLSRSQS